MTEIKGETASGGRAIGPAFLLPSPSDRPDAEKTAGSRDELRRIEAAIPEAEERLDRLRAAALDKGETVAADIIDVQRMMLADPDFRAAMRTSVCEDGLSAETAVRRAGERFAQAFSESGDDVLEARAADVRDASELLAACLAGSESSRTATEPSVSQVGNIKVRIA